MPSEWIRVEKLRVQSRIGVGAEERASEQELVVTLIVELDRGGAEDDVATTIDYQGLAELARSIAAARPRSLLETLAREILAAALALDGSKHVRIEVDKPSVAETLRCGRVGVTVEAGR